MATDLDGTLLHTDGTVTPRTREVLTAVEDRGVTVVFVTGRPVRWMEHLWEHVGGHGLAILSNGGIVYDVRRRAVSRARTIPVDVGLKVADILREAAPGTSFAVETLDGFAKEPEFLPQVPPTTAVAVGPLEDVLEDSAVKILARHDHREPEDFWAEVESQVGHLVTTTWSSRGALVEISAAGVSKATTLEMVCRERGIRADEVVGFGDMPNDLAMLGWVGTSYAMANAHRLVRDHADQVAPSNEEDGVAAVLEKLFDLEVPHA